MKFPLTLAFGTLATLAACSDPQSPSHTPEPGSHPLAAISDGAHGGNSQFLFLPPLVPDPVSSGIFDDALSPVVEICALVATSCGTAPADLIATFTMNTGPGSETVRVDPVAQHYIVNWQTDQVPADPTKHYRIRVIVAGAQVGFLDVDVFASAKEFKNRTTGDIVPLLNGRTVPVKFRIEQGLVVSVSVSPNPAGVIVGQVTQVAATLTDAHGGVVNGKPVSWTTETPAIATVDASGQVTGVLPGSTTVTASAEGISGSSLVNVIPPPVVLVTVTPVSSDIKVGETVQLVATLRDAGSNVLTGRIIAWSSANVGTATVDANGLVTGTGVGTISITAVAETVSGGASVAVSAAGFTLVSLSLGEDHACGLDQNGKAFCWGRNDFGQAGIGVSGGRLAAPKQVAGNESFVQIAAGSLDTCALRADGVAYCWGANNVASLGDGTFINHSTPQPVQTTVRFKQIANRGGTPCAIALDDTAWCWGWQDNDRLGNSSTASSPVPVPVIGGRTYKSIFSGMTATCGLTFAGAAYCWGVAGANGSTGSSFGSGPLAIAGGHVFTTLTLGQEHACGLDGAAAMWCWGVNGEGQFGVGTTSNSVATTPVLAAPGNIFVAIDAGLRSTCGLTATGAAYCWGKNNLGQLGDGTTATRLTPVLVTSTSLSSLAIGRENGAGLAPDGAVYGWGSNFWGTIGDGTFVDRLTATRTVPPVP